MMQNNLGSKILECRQNRGMTQEELAGRIGVTPQALSKWERGQSLPDVTLLADLCSILGCSADYLLGTMTEKITENDDEKSQNEIWANLRNCLEPLELSFGKNLVPAFIDKFFVGDIVEARKHLSKEGILMPLVRIKDDLQLAPNEFVILSYGKELHREKVKEITDFTSKSIVKTLEQVVRYNYAEILNRDMVRDMVENLQKKYPALISETVPTKISYGFLTDVLKKFVSRGNSPVYLVRVIEILDDSLRRKGMASPEELVETLEGELG